MIRSNEHVTKLRLGRHHLNRIFWLSTLMVLAGAVIAQAISVVSNRTFHTSKQIPYAVEGHVLVNGMAAANVNVAFHPLDNSKPPLCPVGRTDSQGVFHLTTYASSDGAPTGDYNVTFVWPDTTIEFDECECPDPLIHDRFKGMYAPTELGFRITISSKNEPFQFNLWRPRTDDPLP